MNREAEQFIQELESRFNGPLTYRTYSTWFASSEGLVRDFGVFVFKINDVFHYEDFERNPSMFGFALKPSKKQKPYVKMEGSFTAEDVINISTVTKNAALACANGYLKAEDIPQASLLKKFFSRLVSKVELKGGTTLFFEFINQKEFANALKGESK
jgi:hypothetical protein